MIRKTIIVVLTLATVGTVFIWAANPVTRPVGYFSTDAYCLRFQPVDGQLHARFDGRLIPTWLPRWSFDRLGFVLDVNTTGWPTVHAAVPLWLLLLLLAVYPTIASFRGPLRRRRRRKRGLCLKCGYDLRGTTGGVCSECGEDTAGHAAEASS